MLTLKKKKFKKNFIFKKLNIVTIFLKTILKKGKKLKFFNIFFSIFFDIFYIVKKKINVFFSFNDFLKKQNSDKNNFNVNTLLNWYSQHFYFFFFTYLWKPRKNKSRKKKAKNKKIKQKKFSIMKYFLKKNKRFSIFFKFFFLKMINFSEFTLKSKLLKNFCDLFLNYRNSWIYRFKIKFYKKLLAK